MLYSDHTSKQAHKAARAGMKVPPVVAVAQQRGRYASAMKRPMQSHQLGMSNIVFPKRFENTIPGRVPTAAPPQTPRRPFGLHPDEAMKRIGLMYARKRFSAL